jgi:hypothetical protein
MRRQSTEESARALAFETFLREASRGTKPDNAKPRQQQRVSWQSRRPQQLHIQPIPMGDQRPHYFSVAVSVRAEIRRRCVNRTLKH